MKKLILTLILGALGFTASAQGEFLMDIFYPPEVPKEVQYEFEKLHPGVEDVSWEVEKGNYEAEFEVNGRDYEVIMDPMGKVLYSEEEISSSELPQEVHSYIQGAYPGKEVTEASRITDCKGTVTYEAEVKRDDLLFASDGTFLEDI